jgi:hypothetical protein
MDAGATFLLGSDHQALDDHLWIVLSDPRQFPDQVVIVSFTTHTPEKDQACVVESHEHVWLRRRSCISYPHAKVVTVDELEQLRIVGKIILKDPLSPELLDRVRQRADDSTMIPEGVADILIDQGIIRLDD